MGEAIKIRNLQIDRRLFVMADTGCDLFEHCLTCPLPFCRYDKPGWVQEKARQERREGVLRMRILGTPISEIADAFAISPRTVNRYLSPRAELPTRI